MRLVKIFRPPNPIIEPSWSSKSVANCVCVRGAKLHAHVSFIQFSFDLTRIAKRADFSKFAKSAIVKLPTPPDEVLLFHSSSAFPRLFHHPGRQRAHHAPTAFPTRPNRKPPMMAAAVKVVITYYFIISLYEQQQVYVIINSRRQSELTLFFFFFFIFFRCRVPSVAA